MLVHMAGGVNNKSGWFERPYVPLQALSDSSKPEAAVWKINK